MITVFFDGKCGLCSKEISHYRKIAPDGIFIWQDITKSADDLKANGIIPKFIFNATFRQSIFEDKIEEKNRLYRDIRKGFSLQF